MAKGLGGGFPIGAIWISEQYAYTFGPGSHGTTFGGSPLACSAAHAVLDVLEQEDLIHAAREKGADLHKKLSEFISKYPDLVSEVRGRGLMLALAFKNDPAPLVKKLREAGIKTDMSFKSNKLAKQFKEAHKRNIPNVVVVGPDDIETGTIQWKNMISGEQKTCTVEELIIALQS